MLSLKFLLSGTQAAVVPDAIILPGDAGVQLRDDRGAALSVGGLHAVPCGVFLHW